MLALVVRWYHMLHAQRTVAVAAVAAGSLAAHSASVRRAVITQRVIAHVGFANPVAAGARVLLMRSLA